MMVLLETYFLGAEVGAPIGAKAIIIRSCFLNHSGTLVKWSKK